LVRGGACTHTLTLNHDGIFCAEFREEMNKKLQAILNNPVPTMELMFPHFDLSKCTEWEACFLEIEKFKFKLSRNNKDYFSDKLDVSYDENILVCD
jgi:hypothetical protein